MNFQNLGPRRFHHDYCSMCREAIDFSDLNATICFCGNKVCGWCFVHIMDNQNGQCPECAGPIFAGSRNFSDIECSHPRQSGGSGDPFQSRPQQGPPPPHQHSGRAVPGANTHPNHSHSHLMERGPNFSHMPQDRVMPRDRSSSLGHGPRSMSLDRRSLQNLRVIQRHLIYVIGLPPSLSSVELLASADFFGQYGKVVKVVVNNHEGVAPDDPRYGSVSAYITFQYRDDARSAIRAVDGFWLEGRHLRASFGTTKYCNNFARSLPCTNPDCLYLHELGDPEDRFTKEEIQAGLARQHAAMDRDFVLTGKVIMGGPSGTGLRPNKPVLPPPQMEVPAHMHGGMPPADSLSHPHPHEGEDAPLTGQVQGLVQASGELQGVETGSGGAAALQFAPGSPILIHHTRPVPPRQSHSQQAYLSNLNQSQGQAMGMTSSSQMMHSHQNMHDSPLFHPQTPPMKPRLPPRASPSSTCLPQKWTQMEAHQRNQISQDIRKTGDLFSPVSMGPEETQFFGSNYSFVPTKNSDIPLTVWQNTEESGPSGGLNTNAGRRAMSLDSLSLSALEQRQKGYRAPNHYVLAQMEGRGAKPPETSAYLSSPPLAPVLHVPNQSSSASDFRNSGQGGGFLGGRHYPQTAISRETMHRAMSLGSLKPGSGLGSTFSPLVGGNPRGFEHSAVFPVPRHHQVSPMSEGLCRVESDLSVDPYASPDLRSVKVTNFLDTSLPPVDCHTPSPSKHGQGQAATAGPEVQTQSQPKAQNALGKGEDSLLAPFLLPEPACPLPPEGLKRELSLTSYEDPTTQAPASAPSGFSLLGGLGHSLVQDRSKLSAPPGLQKPVDGSSHPSSPESEEEEVVPLDKTKLESLMLDMKPPSLCSQSERENKEGIIWGSFEGTELQTPKTPSSSFMGRFGADMTTAVQTYHNFGTALEDPSENKVAASLDMIQQMFPLVNITHGNGEAAEGTESRYDAEGPIPQADSENLTFVQTEESQPPLDSRISANFL